MLEKARARTFLLSLGAMVAAVAIAAPLAVGASSRGASSSARYPAKANVKQGKVLFIAACGGCHTLAAAGTKGKRGGNLGQEPSAYGAIVTQISYGGEGMPGFKTAFTPTMIKNIAAYVAKSTPYSGAGGGG